MASFMMARGALRIGRLGSSAVRTLHSSTSRAAITKFTMPAMSPTMTEGGLATWKVKDGQSFSAGDVLLEIETDKATMDVEAQDDGIMAKIVVQEGEKGVPVGKTIAMLAEEGDDISNVEVPAEDESKPAESSASSSSSSSSSPSLEEKSAGEASARSQSPSSSSSGQEQVQSSGHAPKLSKPMLPSVTRLLLENHVSQADAEKIKGTGLRGMLTKGDVLAFLGKASSPTGSYKEIHQSVADLGAPAQGPHGTGGGGLEKPKKSEPLTADSVRSLILGGLADSSRSARSRSAASPSTTTAKGRTSSAFDELLDDYQFAAHAPKKQTIQSQAKGESKDSFAGLL